MKICTFFGHRDCNRNTEQPLRNVLVELIEQENVTRFYVGNQGDFDAAVRRVLIQLAKEYPICYDVVLAYMPKESNRLDGVPTLFPDGIETVPRRFAVCYRNQWMLERADYVVTFVEHSWGGAAKYKAMAEKKGKKVITLFNP